MIKGIKQMEKEREEQTMMDFSEVKFVDYDYDEEFETMTLYFKAPGSFGSQLGEDWMKNYGTDKPVSISIEFPCDDPGEPFCNLEARYGHVEIGSGDYPWIDVKPAYEEIEKLMDIAQDTVGRELKESEERDDR